VTRILIAEPSKTLAALIKLSLGELGVELEVTHDGAAALAAARQRLPDALVTDQALSGLDGYALAHAVKGLASERNRLVPTLLLVSEHAPPDAERLAYVGISDVLPKPFERAVLLERVRALLDVRAPTPANLSYSQPLVSSSAPTAAPAPDLGALVEAQLAPIIGPLLAQKLPALVDAAVARLLPERVQQLAERAVAERVPALVEAGVRRVLAELATPTAIQRIVSEDSRALVVETVQRMEGRLESELLERLDRFAKEVLPQRLQAHAEQVIWKIVPTIAEDIVKDEIKRLTQEHP